ncbi:hypothetical protein [Geobacillus subterraneus]|uniref:Uncharacterized protein n=1 Tax=Geobacillus subterraneus TaxID=129338 RepID=A0A679G4K5_9BACL|nr:hypothetical protein [Geobacillus subterraneus]BBW98981.1 hypothetical protein GsuE55_38140 [Geobacillus subterraneus]
MLVVFQDVSIEEVRKQSIARLVRVHVQEPKGTFVLLHEGEVIVGKSIQKKGLRGVVVESVLPALA